MSRTGTRMYNGNRFKLGLFGMNCSGGLTMTLAPEYWEASWENNLKAAQLADDAGLEFILPIGRWRGYGGISRDATCGSSAPGTVWGPKAPKTSLDGDTPLLFLER